MSVPDEVIEVARRVISRGAYQMTPDELPYEHVARTAIEAVAPAIQSAAWLEGMNHVLSWLALRQFSETMAKDNPYGRKL